MVNPEDVPQAAVEAARKYDRENRPRGNWGSVPEAQVRRLLVGAWNELQREAESHG